MQASYGTQLMCCEIDSDRRGFGRERTHPIHSSSQIKLRDDDILFNDHVLAHPPPNLMEAR
jgi:hypothetical protein